MRRRQVQRNVRSSVLGTIADSVEVRVLLSADPAMAAVDVVADDAVSAEQPAAEQNLAVGEPDFDVVDIRIITDPVICDQPVAFQPDGSFGEADVNEADSTVPGDDTQAIAECGVLLQPEQLSVEPQVITCQPYNLIDESQQPVLLGLSENFEFGGAAESGIVDVTAFGGASRFAQFYNPVAFVSGSVTAEIELASAAEYDQDGNLIAPAVLQDRLSGIRYWQPKQFTLQSAGDLTELLQNYGVSDYSVDEQGAWVIPVSPQDSVETLNTVMHLQLAFTLQTNDTVQAQVLLQPVDGQDAQPLLIQLPDSQITVNYESGWIDESQQPVLLGLSENFEFGGAAESGIVDVTAFGGASRFAQFYNPVAFVSGSVTAEIELASAAEYDQDGNLIAPAVLQDRLSGIRYWQPKQFTLQSAGDLTELLQNYGVSDYSVDEQGAWVIPVSPQDSVETLNTVMHLQLAFTLQTNDTVQAQVLLQPVDGQDAQPLLIQLPDSQITVNYESGWTDPIWQTGEWQNTAVQIQASGAFNGTMEVAEAPAWDESGQLVSAGLLVDVATGLRYRSPLVLTVSGDSLEKLDQLLQDSQWAAGLDTKIVSVTEPDSQTRKIEIAPGTGYDVLQLAGRLSEQTGLQVVVRLVAADEGGVDLEISTAETQLVVIYPVYMYARGSVGTGTTDVQFGTELQADTEVQYGDVLTAVADGPVKFAESVDLPVFAMGRTFGQPPVFAEREVVREAAAQMWVARTRQPQSDMVREISALVSADNTLSRVSGIAAVSLLPELSLPVSAVAERQDEQDSSVQLTFELPAEIQVQATESASELQLLNPGLRRRQPRPVPPGNQQGDVPAEVPVQQPAVPVPGPVPAERSAAQTGPIEVPVSLSNPAIDSLMAAFAAAGLGH